MITDCSIRLPFSTYQQMDAQPCTIDDLVYVIWNLDEESRKEITRAGFDESTAHAFLADRMLVGAADSLIHDGKLLAIVAWVLSETAIHTSFVATPAFFDPKVPSVRFGRKYLQALRQRYSGLPVVSCCYSDRVQVQRWYELIGFVLVQGDSASKIFRLDNNLIARQSYPERPAEQVRVGAGYV